MEPDSDLKQRTEAALRANPAIDPTDLAVNASGGVVMLAGFVRSYGQKAAAEFEAQRVPGVIGVANDIVVRLPEVDRRPDPDIARDAVAALHDQLPSAAEHIMVTVRDGLILLEGVVEWNVERQQAEIAVRWVRGITDVRNLIHLVERPGSPMPTNEHLPLAYIHQPAPVPVQSGQARTREWLLDFDPESPQVLDHLMGWAGSRNPFASLDPLRFADRHSAVEFAQQHGWPYVLRPPPVRRIRPKSYADNFRYDRPN